MKDFLSSTMKRPSRRLPKISLLSSRLWVGNRVGRMRTGSGVCAAGWIGSSSPPRTPHLHTELIQTGYFAPRGVPGFIYWVILYPFHSLVLRGLLKTIKGKAERGLEA